MASGHRGRAHGLFVGVLWLSFDFATLFSVDQVPFAAYTAVGVFALGAVPAGLFAQWGTGTPAAIVGFVFTTGAVGTWRTVQSGLTPVGPTPFGWVGTLAVALLAGVLERRLR